MQCMRMLELLSRHRRFFVTGVLAIFSVGFLGLFNENDKISPAFQSFIVSTIFFLVIPLLYSKIILKESLKNMGWQKGRFVAGIVSGVLCVTLAMVAIFFLIQFSSFQEQYRLPTLVETNFLWFMFYELVLASFTVLLYEVFFRGFIQLFWLRDLGMWAILIQAVIVMALLYFGQDVSWQRVPLMMFTVFSGVIAHVSRSIWYPMVASWFFFFLTDILVLVLH